ncbi:hypothetical protein CRG98_011746 [Punica granatum]|uniref:Uncharacterized protein n=1 Tax=Punica granatum TaxID=22663 RepID=A0A2I0KH43_PUNGR|nr:hypothetical protein CRG98_011746 [Punica granatum]
MGWTGRIGLNWAEGTGLRYGFNWAELGWTRTGPRSGSNWVELGLLLDWADLGQEKRDGLGGRLSRRGIEEIRSHGVMSQVRARGDSGLRCLSRGSSREPWARGVELWGRAPGN